MHELSLSSAIVDIVLQHAEGRQVKVIALRIGHLRQVVPDSLEFCFGFVAKGTVCEGARLEHTIVPAWIRCQACAQEWDPVWESTLETGLALELGWVSELGQGWSRMPCKCSPCIATSPR